MAFTLLKRLFGITTFSDAEKAIDAFLLRKMDYTKREKKSLKKRFFQGFIDTWSSIKNGKEPKIPSSKSNWNWVIKHGLLMDVAEFGMVIGYIIGSFSFRKAEVINESGYFASWLTNLRDSCPEFYEFSLRKANEWATKIDSKALSHEEKRNFTNLMKFVR